MMTPRETLPAITVLMSCYNAALWMDEAINSVLAQTFENFEFIIVDDGSKDDTLKIIRKFSKHDNRIIVVKKENTGLADSLNVGIQMARGEWIARMDADDISEPTRLEKQFRFARTHPGLVFVGTWLTEISSNGNRLKLYRYPARNNSLLRNLKTALKFPPHSSAFYHTKTARAIGGYRTRIRRAQDWDLWLRLSKEGELACLSEPLVRIRRHANQVSHEDLGRRQQIDSRVATTSYFLQQQDFLDPVDGDDIAFRLFRGWLQKRLEDVGLLANADFDELLKSKYNDSPNALIGIFNIITAAVHQPNAMLSFVQRRIIGENLSRHLAQEWMNKL